MIEYQKSFTIKSFFKSLYNHQALIGLMCILGIIASCFFYFFQVAEIYSASATAMGNNYLTDSAIYVLTYLAKSDVVINEALEEIAEKNIVKNDGSSIDFEFIVEGFSANENKETRAFVITFSSSEKELCVPIVNILVDSAVNFCNTTDVGKGNLQVQNYAQTAEKNSPTNDILLSVAVMVLFIFAGAVLSYAIDWNKDLIYSSSDLSEFKIDLVEIDIDLSKYSKNRK